MIASYHMYKNDNHVMSYHFSEIEKPKLNLAFKNEYNLKSNEMLSRIPSISNTGQRSIMGFFPYQHDRQNDTKQWLCLTLIIMINAGRDIQ